MTDYILYQGSGITIAQTDEALTAVPYGPQTHDDGDQNHGWVDLRDHPERVASIPEAQKSAGLAALLGDLAEPGALMTSGCECGLFAGNAEMAHAHYVGGYIDVMFRDGALNTPETLYAALEQWLPGVPPPAVGVHYGYEFIIQPLRNFFGQRDRFSVMVKPIGCGNTPDQAWAAFDAACLALEMGYRATRTG
ncbi:hypothetical protein [Luteibacter sp. UNCMF366Tsu5.1]|uniref:hypothetical protein n=1 Tax=Luteibacter sp. UNCMF366Tsu5.1 TaxID=1502758 RepID=UPI000908EFB4|nr:hypothetical protein [Luteibacter sp. UNCMF366Tsu5.1]SFW27777.1 hypothetical protein SAMN02800691_0722 [Luteibacter sp. UNCMF366Tsu5.1]